MRVDSEQHVAMQHSEGSLHLWLVHPEILEAQSRTPDLGRLHASESARLAAMSDEKQRVAYAARHLVLRRLLAAYTGVPAADLAFHVLPGGKPVLAYGMDGPHFSISSSQGYLLAALSWDQPVGADLEAIRTDVGVRSVSQQYFSPVELGTLAAEPEAGRLMRFFQIWTRKEALLKLHGLGLNGLAQLKDPACPLNKAWIEDLQLPHGLAGSVALPRAPVCLELHHWAVPPYAQTPVPAAMAAAAMAAA
jgi:phosphopantetheinyl transferase